MRMHTWFVPALMAVTALASDGDGHRRHSQAVEAALGGHVTSRIANLIRVAGHRTAFPVTYSTWVGTARRHHRAGNTIDGDLA
ncbi:MAG: hypothetical protein ACTHXB_05925 [Luteimonas sp.]